MKPLRPTALAFFWSLLLHAALFGYLIHFDQKRPLRPPGTFAVSTLPVVVDHGAVKNPTKTKEKKHSDLRSHHTGEFQLQSTQSSLLANPVANPAGDQKGTKGNPLLEDYTLRIHSKVQRYVKVPKSGTQQIPSGTYRIKQRIELDPQGKILTQTVEPMPQTLPQALIEATHLAIAQSQPWPKPPVAMILILPFEFRIRNE